MTLRLPLALAALAALLWTASFVVPADPGEALQTVGAETATAAPTPVERAAPATTSEKVREESPVPIHTTPPTAAPPPVSVTAAPATTVPEPEPEHPTETSVLVCSPEPTHPDCPQGSPPPEKCPAWIYPASGPGFVETWAVPSAYAEDVLGHEGATTVIEEPDQTRFHVTDADGEPLGWATVSACDGGYGLVAWETGA